MADAADGGINVKKARLDKIIEIVKTQQVGTQDEIVDILRAEGYDVSQATVSRDIKELRLRKAAAPGIGYRYVLPDSGDAGEHTERLRSVFAKSILHIERVGNLVIIKTPPGLGNAACLAVDGMGYRSVAGTLAGDDTGLIITRGDDDAESLCKELERLIED